MSQTGEEGFTLVEAIAALAISAIAAAGLMAALGSAGGRSLETEARHLALRQARFLLSEAVAVADPDSLPTRGEAEQVKLAWTLKVGLANEPYQGVRQLKVEVMWKAAGKEGVTRLEAYRTAPS